jgi:hypothetical protein
LTCDLITNLEDFNEFKDQLILFDKTKKLKFEKSQTTKTPIETVIPKQTATPTQVDVPEIYRDNFEDPESGWFQGQAQRENFWDTNHPGVENVAELSLEQNHYKLFVPRHRGSNPPGQVDTFWVWPALKAPIPNSMLPIPQTYCIEAKAKFDKPTWVARWGIVFGADEDFDDLYVFHINDNKNRAIINYQNYLFPGNNSFRHCVYQGDCKRNYKEMIIGWYPNGGQNPIIKEAPEYNVLKVIVKSNEVLFFVNEEHIDTLSSANFPKDHIGIIGGSWEVTPVDLQFDYFEFEPNCAESQN